MAQAAETLLQISQDEKFTVDEEISYLTFCAQSLEYLILPEQKYVELANPHYAAMLADVA